MLEQIGIDHKVEREKVKSILSDVFKDLKAHYFDQATTWEIEDEDNLSENFICFSLFENESEFPIRIEITRTPDSNNEEREQYLAKIFSDRLSCKTITNYKEADKSKDYPYDSIIFENGRAYLANDSDTIWADGEGGMVEVIKEVQLINYRFDDKGNLIKDNS